MKQIVSDRKNEGLVPEIFNKLKLLTERTESITVKRKNNKRKRVCDPHAVSYTHLDVYKRQVYIRVCTCARETFLDVASRVNAVKGAINYVLV